MLNCQNPAVFVDVLGRTRATLTETTSNPPWPEGLGNLVKLCRAGDRALQLLLFNEECLVSASHQLALITSLPFYVQGADSGIYTRLIYGTEETRRKERKIFMLPNQLMPSNCVETFASYPQPIPFGEAVHRLTEGGCPLYCNRGT